MIADVLIITVEHPFYKEVFDKLKDFCIERGTWTAEDEQHYQESIRLWRGLHEFGA